MSAQKKKKLDAWESVSIRLPPAEVRRFEAKAAEANLFRGTYIARRLLENEPEPWPTLAVLAHVIAIHEAVLTSSTISAEQVAELRSIVRDLSRLAREEALR